jgi:hypothetical protein
MLRQPVWSSKNLLNSAIACVSSRPLRMNTENLPRAAVSILKVIDQALDGYGSRDCAALHCFHHSADHE